MSASRSTTRSPWGPLPSPPSLAVIVLALLVASEWHSRNVSSMAEGLSSPMAAMKAINPATTLQCHRRLYNYKVVKNDSEGKICWDYISVMSCWGRCDSNEISDWRFPYKKSYHPVCMYGERTLFEVNLRNCDPGVEPGTERYKYYEAITCVCSVCSSSSASCEGLRYRGQRSSLLYLQGRV